MYIIYRIFLVLTIAFQPLHSYTTINTSSIHDENGFHLLHSELCGSKYSNGISHTKQISKLLDRINNALLTDMPEDCVCCTSIDITALDGTSVYVNQLLSGLLNKSTVQDLYSNFIQSSKPTLFQSRSPPKV